ncbi:MAG: hypothetical protein LBV32_08495 [Tannerellaceae bacterium]|nr:hypothetical protein [Tannerellaceae bacterium]
MVEGRNLWSCYVRPGTGNYVPGVPFVFSGDENSPARTLTANTAMISGQSRNTNITPPDGGYVAPWTIELQANDRAILDDCQIGWYSNIPIFSGGWYKITNPFVNTWGTFDNATELP